MKQPELPERTENAGEEDGTGPRAHRVTKDFCDPRHIVGKFKKSACEEKILKGRIKKTKHHIQKIRSQNVIRLFSSSAGR